MKRLRAKETAHLPGGYALCAEAADAIEALQTQPNRRLIDADAFLEMLRDYAITPGDFAFCAKVEYAISKAPTIN